MPFCVADLFMLINFSIALKLDTEYSGEVVQNVS